LKIVLNTTYGLLGNKLSPLFWLPMAASITAFSRTATRTAKNIIESHGHQFLFADTDSVFAVLNPDIKNNEQYMSAV
jgi:DNA polymerase elongation subunit (family B)